MHIAQVREKRRPNCWSAAIASEIAKDGRALICGAPDLIRDAADVRIRHWRDEHLLPGMSNELADVLQAAVSHGQVRS